MKKDTRLLMGMPITIEVIDSIATKSDLDAIFSYFHQIDERFSVHKTTSEITKINEGKISREKYSDDMKTIFLLAAETKKLTHGYFDIAHNGIRDPSGIVKGWAIYNAANLLKKRGFKNYYVDAGGDIQVSGKNSKGEPWRIGIKNPFQQDEIVKVLAITDKGVATSGTYIRGQHIYDPISGNRPIKDIVSLTVIGPNVYEADRFATAAFAMRRQGIAFIERLSGFEGYMIDEDGIATYTSGFNTYTISL